MYLATASIMQGLPVVFFCSVFIVWGLERMLLNELMCAFTYRYKTRSGNQPSDEVEAILFRMEIVLTGVLSELLPDGARVSGVDVASSVTDLLSDATDDLRTDLREILDHPTADALTNIADTFLSVLENVLNGSIPDEISHLSVNEVLSQVQAVLLEDLNNVISLSDPNTVVPNLPGSLNQPTSDALTNIVDTFLCILRNALPSLDRSEVQPLLFEVLNTVISLSDPDIVVPNFPRLRDQPTSDALTNVVDAFLCTLRNALPSLDRSEVQPLLFEVLSTVSSLSKSNSSTANTNTTDAVNITVVLNFPRSLDHVSRPAFFFHWLLLVIGPLIMVATTVHILCWKSTATTMFVVSLIQAVNIQHANNGIDRSIH